MKESLRVYESREPGLHGAHTQCSLGRLGLQFRCERSAGQKLDTIYTSTYTDKLHFRNKFLKATGCESRFEPTATAFYYIAGKLAQIFVSEYAWSISPYIVHTHTLSKCVLNSHNFKQRLTVQGLTSLHRVFLHIRSYAVNGVNFIKTTSHCARKSFRHFPFSILHIKTLEYCQTTTSNTWFYTKKFPLLCVQSTEINFGALPRAPKPGPI